jgi:hypothetical protein
MIILRSNFFCAEMYPMLNSMAAYQDWDGIYHFDANGPYNQKKINGFFTSAGHPLKQIFIPVGAIMFRMETIKKGENTIQLYLPENAVLETTDRISRGGPAAFSNMTAIWKNAGAPEALTLMHPYEVNLSGTEVRLSEEIGEPDGPWTSETGEITWDNRDSLNAVYTVNAGAVKAAVGYIGGKNIGLGPLTVAMDSTPYNWATITLTSLDGNAIEEAGEILLIAAGRVENTDMGWNEEKTTVGSEWGRAPSRAEGIPAKITLSNAGKFRVYVLDPDGNRMNEIPVRKDGDQRSFTIGAQHKTLWYLLER